MTGALVAAPAPDPAAAEEAERVAVVAKIAPAVVAVCMYGGQADGSGVCIDPEGYVLTNVHVTEASGPVMSCGMADGELYDGVLVGTDEVGDVALVKMLPKVPGKPFPFVQLGDSDAVRAGDWSLAMGNPFGVALDFAPTVTYGLVSGVNRYQPPGGGGTLEYTDCIQVDTSINPGNSGGPLFNMKGELIGINGRISLEKRGRVNVGVGYAISINQIKNFLGHLRAGIATDHATLGAAVATEKEDGELARMTVKEVLPDSDAARRGLQEGDRVVSFAGRPLTSTNQYKNVLGIYPKEWRLPLAFRRGDARQEALVRLMGLLPPEAKDDEEEKPKPRGPMPPERKDPSKERAKLSPAQKLYDPKPPRFANYHFNKQAQDRLLAKWRGAGDFRPLKGAWSLDGRLDLADRGGDARLTWREGGDGLTEVKLSRGGIDEVLEPLKADQPLGAVQAPQGSGGFLAALYLWRRLLTGEPAQFEGEFSHGGVEPFYPPRPDFALPPEGYRALRVDCEVLRTRHAGFEGKWYFDPATGRMLGAEVYTASGEDPCELYFGEYKDVEGRKFPHRVECVYAGKRYGVFTARSLNLEAK